MRRPLAFSILAMCSLALCGETSFLRADAKNPTYADDVLPVLKQHCTNCHSNDKQKGGLNLATFPALQEGGSSGAVVAAGDPDKSRLLSLSSHKEEPKMPPNGSKVPDAQLAVLKLWIEQGARETSASKTSIAAKPKTDIGLKSVVKGRPVGPPPMPQAGKLTLDPPIHGRRPGAVIALAASPWAPLIAVGGQKQVLLYNADSGILAGVLPFEPGQVNVLKFSRNAKFLLAAGGRGGHSGKAVLFNVETGAKVTEVGNEADAVLAADISADQTQIALGGPGKVVRVYATADGSIVREIKKHTDWVTAIEYSPDGVLLATGDRNGGLFVWEAFTGREYFSLRGHTGPITDLSWRDDSNVLASAAEDGTVRLWEMENGGQIKTWAAHNGGAASVRFGHDGKLASTGRDRVTKLWDQNGGLQKQFEPFPDLGLRVAVTHDNAKVVAGDWSGVVKAWTAADAKVSAILDANPPPLAERIKTAEATFVASQVKAKTTADSFVAAQVRARTAGEAYAIALANAAKAPADLAAARKAVVDLTNAANAAKTAVDQAKAEAEKAAGAATAAAGVVVGKDVALKAFTEAAGKIDAELKKAPQNAELAAQARRATEFAQALAAEKAAAEKATAAALTAQKAMAEKFAAAQKAFADATALAAEAPKKAAALQALVKPAADAVAPAKTALDQANAAVGPAKTAADAAAVELNAAKAYGDAIKAATPPLKN